MIAVNEFTPIQRQRIVADLKDRAMRARSQEWRQFWEAEILFLQERGDEAVAKLNDLKDSSHREIAAASLLSLGEWYESIGATALARDAYSTLVDLEGAKTDTLPRVRLARLYNAANESALAVAALHDLVVNPSDIPEDMVQFVVAEYYQALLRMGRTEAGHAFVSRVLELFPAREEIARIKDHFSREHG